MSTAFVILGPNAETTTKPQDSSFAKVVRDLGRYASPEAAPDCTIFVDLNQDPSRLIPGEISKKPWILIRQEPRVVLPQNYKSDYIANFSLIIDVGRTASDYVSRVNWPQTWNLEHLESDNLGRERLNRFVVINANKISFVKGELYSLRRIAAQKSPDVDVYGFDWDIDIAARVKRLIDQLSVPIKYGLPLSVRAHKGWFKQPLMKKGQTQDKLETLAKYNYSLVIENSIDYMSEKLLDSLMAGTLPIYVGPDLRLFGIPDFAAIQTEPNVKSILKAVQEAKNVDIDAWRESIRTWLRSEGVEERWSSKFVMREIIGIIDSHLHQK
jgi:hypothetical protein